MVAADGLNTADAAREHLVQNLLTSGTLKVAFELKGKGKVTYSTTQHTSSESGCVRILTCQ